MGSKFNRRNFFKLSAVSAGTAVLLDSCEQSVNKFIPLVVQPEELVLGKGMYYSTVFFDGGECYPVTAKCMNGRPVKLEGNASCNFTGGGSSAKIQASLFGLYSPSRIQAPTINKKSVKWSDFDKEVIVQLNKLKDSKKTLLYITNTIVSPSSQKLINEFVSAFPNCKHLMLDVVPQNYIAESHKIVFGEEKIPLYHFEKAECIVGFHCDFLGTWLMPLMFQTQYAQRAKDSFRHIQFESSLTITGSMAHERYAIHPHEEKVVLSEIFNQIAIATNNITIEVGKSTFDVKKISQLLLKNKGKSLVVSGTNDFEIQKLVTAINCLLENYGNTIDMNQQLNCCKGSDKLLFESIDNVEVGGVIVQDIDMLRFFEASPKVKMMFENVDFSMAVSVFKNKTTEKARFVCAESHFYESWNDAEPISANYLFAQPITQNVFDSRQWQDSLLVWMNKNTSFYDYLKHEWSERHSEFHLKTSFDDFWEKSLQFGHFEAEISRKTFKYSLEKAFQTFQSMTFTTTQVVVMIVPPVNISLNNDADNAWLHELPHPLTKQSWGNAAFANKKWMTDNHLENGQEIRINNSPFPVIELSGQAYNSITIEMGYGRMSYAVVENVGYEAEKLLQIENNERLYCITNAKLEFTNRSVELVFSQKKVTYEHFEASKILQPFTENEISLYPAKQSSEKRYAMAIDTTKCIGCGACAIACVAENNIPTVGSEEVAKGRLMHWLKIDTYINEKEQSVEILQIPVMCQHCNNAPCENVCPTSATSHTSNGVNQMVYNRCIGTRFCANACPYKARTFNWFDYTGSDMMPRNNKQLKGVDYKQYRKLLNPNVTVRTKGIMEKCTFCYQRIIEANETISGQIPQTACMQACSSKAIVFGFYDEFVHNGEMKYTLLGEFNTQPSIFYYKKNV